MLLQRCTMLIIVLIILVIMLIIADYTDADYCAEYFAEYEDAFLTASCRLILLQMVQTG